MWCFQVKQDSDAKSKGPDVPPHPISTLSHTEVPSDTVLPCELTKRIIENSRNDHLDQRVSQPVGGTPLPMHRIREQAPACRDWNGGSTDTNNNYLNPEILLSTSRIAAEQFESELCIDVKIRPRMLDHRERSVTVPNSSVASVDHGACTPSTNMSAAHVSCDVAGAQNNEHTSLNTPMTNNNNNNNSAKYSPPSSQARFESEPESVDFQIGQQPTLLPPTPKVQPGPTSGAVGDACSGAEYERQRDERVRRNQQLMAELGLAQTSAQLLAASNCSKAKAAAHKKHARLVCATCFRLVAWALTPEHQ